MLQHRIVLPILALGVILAGCTSSSPPTTTPSAPPPTGAPAPTPATTATPTVHATTKSGDSNTFEPSSLSVKIGDTVTWDIVGEGHHTVTFKQDPNGGSARLDSGDLGSGQTFKVTFQKPGAYTFYCRYHSDGTHGMVGSITVA